MIFILFDLYHQLRLQQLHQLNHHLSLKHYLHQLILKKINYHLITARNQSKAQISNLY